MKKVSFRSPRATTSFGSADLGSSQIAFCSQANTLHQVQRHALAAFRHDLSVRWLRHGGILADDRSGSARRTSAVMLS